MAQFIGFIIAGYCSVKMIEILLDKNKDSGIKVFAAINLIATLFFSLMIFSSGATLPK